MIIGLRLESAHLRFRNNFSIKYENSFNIWERDDNYNFAFTIFKGPSGCGKSSLIREIYEHIKFNKQNEQIEFNFNPNLGSHANNNIAIVPQKCIIAKHWRVSNLIPTDSEIFRCFFPNQNGNILNRRMGELSGGQQLRVYTVSCLEQIRSLGKNYNFLLLDETLDGIGSEDLITYLRNLQDYWEDSGDNLQIALITHLNQTRIAEELDAKIVFFENEKLENNQLSVKIYGNGNDQ